MLIIAAAVIFFIIIISLSFRTKDEKVTIGLVLSGKTTEVGWNWQELYKIIIKEFIHDSSDNSKNHWFGLETGAVVLSEVSPVVTEEVKEKIAAAREDIISGNDVFSGVIYDNQGKMRCDSDETISADALLNNMDWFVEGVEIYE